MRRAITAASLHRVVTRYLEHFPDEATDRLREASAHDLAVLLESIPPRVALAISEQIPDARLVAALGRCDARQAVQLLTELPPTRRAALSRFREGEGSDQVRKHLRSLRTGTAGDS